MQTMTKPREMNRREVVDAIMAAGIHKQRQAYSKAMKIKHRTVAGHLIYKSNVVEAWISEHVRRRE